MTDLPATGQGELTVEGRTVYVESRSSQLPGDPPGTLLFIRDVTSTRVADQTIRTLFQFLQDRDEDRTRLLRRTNSTIEAERNRIARDIHDGPIQGISAASLSLEAVKMMLAAGDAEQGRGHARRGARRAVGRGREPSPADEQPAAAAAGRARPHPRRPRAVPPGGEGPGHHRHRRRRRRPGRPRGGGGPRLPRRAGGADQRGQARATPRRSRSASGARAASWTSRSATTGRGSTRRRPATSCARARSGSPRCASGPSWAAAPSPSAASPDAERP